MHPNWNGLQKVVERWLVSKNLPNKQVIVEPTHMQTAVIRIKNAPRPRESIREDPLSAKDWKTILKLPLEDRDIKTLSLLQSRQNKGITEDDFPQKRRLGRLDGLIQCQNRVNVVFRKAGVKYRLTYRGRYYGQGGEIPYKIMVKRARSK